MAGKKTEAKSAAFVPATVDPIVICKRKLTMIVGSGRRPSVTHDRLFKMLKKFEALGGESEDLPQPVIDYMEAHPFDPTPPDAES